MKFLLDTNILIPIEPVSEAGIESGSEAAIEFVRLSQTLSHELFIHPAANVDLARDNNPVRRKVRLQLLGKYRPLERPPVPSEVLLEHFQEPSENSNDWVDMQLLAALAADAIDYLVTEDRGIHRRAARVGLASRVCSIGDAAAVVRGLHTSPPPPPAPTADVPLYSISVGDPIFHSLRTDYQGFDEWLTSSKRQHRRAWVVPGDTEKVAAICIYKTENSGEYNLKGKVLKISTFKVSESFQGLRYGELLLKTAFRYAAKHAFDWLFVTVFEKHGGIVDLFENFGFQALSLHSPLGELVLAKRLVPTKDDFSALSPLEFNIQFGPERVMWDRTEGFIVPIQPRYHRLLLPDAEPQPELALATHPFGNAIRKAYLCHAPIRRISPGSLLFFYRSGGVRPAITCMGVVEEVLVSSNANHIARFVGKRTVYSLQEIQELARKEVLTILFRQSRVVRPILISSILAGAVLRGPPQTITTVREPGLRWLHDTLGG